MTERTLCVSDPSISQAVEAGGIAVEPDPVRAAAILSTAVSGATGRAPADDPLVIVLSDQHLDVTVAPRSGCALITTTPVAAAGATLVVHDSGTAVLLPEREHLAPQHLSSASTRDVVEVLSAADLPDADQPGGAEDAGVAGQASLWESPPMPSEEVIDLRGDTPTAATRAHPDRISEQRLLPVDAGVLLPEGPASDDPAGDDPAPRDGHEAPVPAGAAVPRVLVLGEVRVENAHGRYESTRIGRLAETAAFVLLNPSARPSELQGALWPGRRSNPQTCRQMISRARTWLGRTDAGEPYLMTFAETGGRLRLRPEVGSDWADFQQLAARGLADPEDTDHLTAALALVRGRPFGAVASRELPWADLHINEMLCLITDVAHALAERHERAGRPRAARDAALRGLRTESESEVLEAIVARTGA
jgi:hypothetical protein